MPEFGPNGRNAYFVPDPYEYWIASYRSGFDLRVTDALLPSLPIFYELLALALTLPAALLLRRWPAIRQGTPSLAPTVALISRMMLGSLVLFLAAHALLFRLYLPARFVAWTVPLALAIAAGVGIAALITWVVAGLSPTPQPPPPCAGERETAGPVLRLPRARGRRLGGRGIPALVVAGLLAVGLACYPAHYDGNFVTDRTPALSAYLRALPPDTVVLAPPGRVRLGAGVQRSPRAAESRIRAGLPPRLLRPGRAADQRRDRGLLAETRARLSVWPTSTA